MRSARKRSLSARSAGFSIIELLIVLAIISILALAGAPWFAKVSQRSQIKSAAQELSLTLAAARMRAVKRNLPASVVLTRATSTQPYNLVETFENTVPTPIKVGEIRIPQTMDFPTSGTYYAYNPQVIFGPDGRNQNSPNFTVFTVRGLRGGGTQNDLPVAVEANGKIEVFGPNPTVSKPKGTEWH